MRGHHAWMDILLVDAIGPFFRNAPAGRLNWSKIPFAFFQRGHGLDEQQLMSVLPDFERFCRAAAETGFNSISLDDVAHLMDSEAYPPSLRDLVAGYRRFFRRLFSMASSHGLRVFLTADLMFFPRSADDALCRRMARPAFLAEGLRALLAEFPEIAGIIVRIGESDGLDVRDEFRSRLTIRTPSQCRTWIAALLRVCEEFSRDLIVRTWSVGAYKIGDLIWNRDTYRRVFSAFASNRLIVSMKYGETDFFRFLPLNPQFLCGSHRKMIEVQTRREYEGCGEYPSFVGWDYQRYRDELRAVGVELAGVMVWCQTGGWATFRRLTYLEGSSVWTELNTHVTLRLFRDGESTEAAIIDWCRKRGLREEVYDVLWLLRLSDEVIRDVLYIEDFAGQKLFFRRLRIPPLLWIFWDQILISHGLSRLLDCFVRDGRRQVLRAECALQKFDVMKTLARRCGLPIEDIEFQRDTFELLVAARRYFFLPDCDRHEQELTALVRQYNGQHPVRHYVVRLDFKRVPIRRASLAKWAHLLVRRQRGYRWIDRIVTLRLLPWLYPLVRRRASLVPEFANERAMGLETIFK